MPRSRSPSSSTLAAPSAPRFAPVWAALVYVLCTLALMYPALGGAFLVSPMSDQFSGYAYRVFAASVLRETGGFPLWNPYILGGLPFVAAQHGDIFYPTFLLRLTLPVDVAMTWSFGLHIFLCGLFTYGFLRAWGFGFFPSLMGGVGYMLSGQVASLVSPGHDGKLYVSALAPLILWMALRGMRDGKLWAWGVVAIATGLCVLSPHYQMTYYTGFLAGAFTIWLAFRKGEGALERHVALRRLALAAAAGVVGLAIGSIQFLPFFEYIAFSPRGGGGRGYEYATSYSMPPEELINAYLPQFSGFLESYWGRNPIKLHSDYLGAALLVLAGAAFGRVQRRAFVRFWLVAAAVALLVAFGGHTPFYRLWYQLPMMKVVRAPSMIYFIVSLATAALGAVGTERLLSGEISRRYLIGWGSAALAIAVLAAVGFFNVLGSAVVEAGREDALAANSSAVIIGAWRSGLFVALAVGILWATSRGRVTTTTAGWLLTAVVAADLWSIDRLYFRFSPPASQLYASDPAIEFLKRQPEPGRVIAVALDQASNIRDPFLDGDAMMIHRVRTVTGHQGNEIQRWVELAGAKSPAVNLQRLLDPQFRRLANVRYLYTNAELPAEIPELPGTRFEKRVGPVKNAVGSTIYLYELNQPGPAAWLAPVIVKAAPERILATVLDPRFDARRAALFDSSADVSGVQVSALPEPSPVVARVTRYEPGRISVALDRPAPAGSALVVSENFYRGWTANVDGRAARVGPTDYTLIGVALPAGARMVELSFQEASYTRGKRLTLLALLVSLLVIVAGVVVDRRSRRG